MPASKSHRVNPVLMAEQIVSMLDAVPGARACFLELTRSGAIKLHTALVGHPEVDRWHSTKNFHCVGVFTRGATTGQIVEDIRETMGKL